DRALMRELLAGEQGTADDPTAKIAIDIAENRCARDLAKPREHMIFLLRNATCIYTHGRIVDSRARRQFHNALHHIIKRQFVEPIKSHTIPERLKRAA